MAEQGELNLIGFFPNPHVTLEDKLAAIKSRSWQPDSDDLDAVVRAGKGVPIEIHGMNSLVGAIIKRARGSIKQLNLLTHASPEHIGLRGLVRGRTIEFPKEADATLTFKSIETYRNTPFFYAGAETVEHSDIVGRFAKGAEMVLFACDSGATKGGVPDREFLVAVASMFNVRVVGFLARTIYCGETGGPTLQYRVGIGERDEICANGLGVRDFHRAVARAVKDGRVAFGDPPKQLPKR